MTSQLIAAIPIGFEKVVAKEIRALGGGIGKTTSRAGRIFFEGPDDAVYRANLRLRPGQAPGCRGLRLSASHDWGAQPADDPGGRRRH